MSEKYFFWFLSIHRGRKKLSTKYIWLKKPFIKIFSISNVASIQGQSLLEVGIMFKVPVSPFFAEVK